MAKDMITQALTEQQKNVEQTDEAKAAYGDNVSALDTTVEQRESDFKNVGGHLFKDTKNTDRSKDIQRPARKSKKAE